MATAAKARTHSGLNQYNGSWDTDAVLHLLRRVHFGVTKEDLDYFKAKTMDEAVNDILTIDYTPPAPPINNYSLRSSDPNVPDGQTWVNDYNSQLNNLRMRSFKSWWSGQIVNHDRSIREQMVLFWHNHFATQADVYNWANFAYQYTATLRADSLKNFKTLVKDMTLDPAMLIFLNGERNTKTAPDENYSRELQELFTLGKGPESNYTEADVQQGAKVLTGWRIDKRNGNVYFQENRHDTTDKVFSSFYNGKVITGKTGINGGEQELDEMLDMIFEQNEVSKYLVRKLYKWFVYYDIDQSVENNVITPLAQILRDNNYELKPVMEALLKSEHFFDIANRGAMIKSPAVFSHGLVRMFDIEIPSSTEYVEQYNHWTTLGSFSALLQQELGDPPSVAGWAAYYQIPMYYELWINSDTLPNRNKITDVLSTFGYNINGNRLKIDHTKFATKFSTIADPTNFIEELLEFFHTLNVDQSQRDYMKTILLSGQLDDHYWTDAWAAHVSNPTDTSKKQVVEQRLAFLFKYLMNLSEFQLA